VQSQSDRDRGISLKVLGRPAPGQMQKGTRKMKEIIARAKEFLRNEDGPTATEYAVMLALIIAVVIGAVTILGRNVEGVFTDVADSVESAGSGGASGGE